jgi:hypothetical protein
VSNPPVREEGENPSHRVWPFPDETEVILVVHRDLPEEKKQTHFLMQLAANDSEINVVLGMLARESSESTWLESGSEAPEQSSGGGKKIGNSEGTRRKRSCQTDSQTESIEVKKKKKRLHHSSDVGVFFYAKDPQDKDIIGKVILRTLSLSLLKVLEMKILSGSNDDDYRNCHRRTTTSS